MLGRMPPAAEPSGTPDTAETPTSAPTTSGHARPAPAICVHCGYDVSRAHDDGSCPECGEPLPGNKGVRSVEDADPLPRWWIAQKRGWRWTLRASQLILIGVAVSLLSFLVVALLLPAVASQTLQTVILYATLALGWGSVLIGVALTVPGGWWSNQPDPLETDEVAATGRRLLALAAPLLIFFALVLPTTVWPGRSGTMGALVAQNALIITIIWVDAWITRRRASRFRAWINEGTASGTAAPIVIWPGVLLAVFVALLFVVPPSRGIGGSGSPANANIAIWFAIGWAVTRHRAAIRATKALRAHEKRRGG